MEKEQSGHYAPLDGLRSLAILMVMAAHVALRIDNDYHPDFLLANSHAVGWFFLNGWIGVQLFFVLSGFLIAGQLQGKDLLDIARRRRHIRRFFKRRFFRIAPMYYLVLTLSSVFAIIRGWPWTHGGKLHWLWIYAYHLAFLQNFMPFPIFNLFWSLATEAQFYILAPFLMLLLARCGGVWRYIPMIGLLLGLLGLKIYVVKHGLVVQTEDDYFRKLRAPLYMSADALLAGVLCQLIWSDNRAAAFLRRVRELVFWPGLIGFIGLAACFKPYSLSPPQNLTFFMETFYSSLVPLAFSLMMLGLLAGSCAGGFFGLRIFRDIATISYSVYLLHVIFLNKAMNVAGPYFAGGYGWFAGWLVAYATLLACAMPVAAISYILIERPFIDWSKKPQA